MIALFSAHLNYDLKNGFYPIAEFNWFHLARAGNETQNIGVAYESVLTGDEDNLMNDHITVDYIIKF